MDIVEEKIETAADIGNHISIGFEDKSLESFNFLNSILPLNYKSGFLNNKRVKTIICRKKEKIIGALFLTHRKYREKLILHIDYVGVDEDYRHLGLAKKMLDKCFEYANSMKINSITARTKVDNIAAQKFFEKNGFLINKKSIRRYNDGLRLAYFTDIRPVE
jgi:ribosomal protein S18 acetylase RimI-like enzyme